MIITGKMLSFGTSGTGNGGDLTTVKTDGTTITGDGNTMPLALGPGEMDGIGSYIFAQSAIAARNNGYADGRGILNRGDIVPGSRILPIRFNLSLSISSLEFYDTIPGTWQYLGSSFTWDYTNALFRRIA